MSGLALSDGTPTAKLLEAKLAYQPVTVTPVDLATGRVALTNEHLFTGLGGYTLAWSITEDGIAVDRGTLPEEALDVGPRSARRGGAAVRAADADRRPRVPAGRLPVPGRGHAVVPGGSRGRTGPVRPSGRRRRTRGAGAGRRPAARRPGGTDERARLRARLLRRARHRVGPRRLARAPRPRGARRPSDAELLARPQRPGARHRADPAHAPRPVTPVAERRRALGGGRCPRRPARTVDRGRHRVRHGDDHAPVPPGARGDHLPAGHPVHDPG